MTLESVGGTAGAWGMGTGIQTHISQDLGLCSAASPRADVVLGQQQISWAESHGSPLQPFHLQTLQE